MLRVLPYIIISIVIYMVLIYMDTYQPDEMNEFIIRLDVFGLTKISQNEHYRVDRIKRLENVGSLEKQALIKHTVFIGATAEMVEYALGQPKQILFNKENNNVKVIYYVYFLANDKRPTVFEFNCTSQNSVNCKLNENYKTFFILSKAYKKSVIDFNEGEAIPAR